MGEVAAGDAGMAAAAGGDAPGLRPDQVTTIYYLARMEEEDGNVAGALSLVREGLSMPITSVCPVTRPEMEEYEKKLEKMQ